MFVPPIVTALEPKRSVKIVPVIVGVKRVGLWLRLELSPPSHENMNPHRQRAKTSNTSDKHNKLQKKKTMNTNNKKNNTKKKTTKTTKHKKKAKTQKTKTQSKTTNKNAK